MVCCRYWKNLENHTNSNRVIKYNACVRTVCDRELEGIIKNIKGNITKMQLCMHFYLLAWFDRILRKTGERKTRISDNI